MLVSEHLFSQVIAGNSFFDQIVSDWYMGYSVDVMGGSSLPADISKNGSGTLGVYESSAEVKFKGANKLHAIDLAVGYKYTHFDFSDMSILSNANGAYANIFYNYNIDEKWSAFTIGRLNFSAQNTASLSNSAYGVFGAGGGYKFSKELSVGFGALAISRLDRDCLAVPIVYVNWKINEHFTLRAFNGLSILYDIFADGKLFINTSLEYKCAYYRLSNNANSSKVSLENSSLEYTVGATYNVFESLYVSASVGANSCRELTIREGGEKINQMDIDVSPQFYLHIGCKW